MGKITGPELKKEGCSLKLQFRTPKLAKSNKLKNGPLTQRQNEFNLKNVGCGCLRVKGQ
jgi:hypothetical protein